MLDTLSMGVVIPPLKFVDLKSRGWELWSRSTSRGIDEWASIQVGGARLTYLAGISHLGCEASLPKILTGDNAVLLDAPGCREGVEMLHSIARAAVGGELPPLTEWKCGRFDPVWAWGGVDPSLYIGSLSLSRFPRTEAVHYSGSVRWVTSSGRVRARCYNKSLEEGHPVDLALRLERQIRRREVVKVDGVELGRSVDDAVSPRVCAAVLTDALHRLGLDSPIPSLAATKSILVNAYGVRRGRYSWAILRDVVDLGGRWSSDVSASTRCRHESMWRDCGVSAVSPLTELPPLVIPALVR